MVPPHKWMSSQSPGKGGDAAEVSVIRFCAVPTATSSPAPELPTSSPKEPAKLSVTPGSMVRTAPLLTSIFSEMVYGLHALNSVKLEVTAPPKNGVQAVGGESVAASAPPVPGPPSAAAPPMEMPPVLEVPPAGPVPPVGVVLPAAPPVPGMPPALEMPPVGSVPPPMEEAPPVARMPPVLWFPPVL